MAQRTPENIAALAGQADHWRLWAGYIRAELASGGPDPHMNLAGWLCRDAAWRDRCWMGICYTAVYTISGAEILYREWPLDRVLGTDYATLDAWITEHGKGRGIGWRRERRQAVTPWSRLSHMLYSAAHWAVTAHQRVWMDPTWRTAEARYEAAWADVIRHLPQVGRYMALHFLEYARRHMQAPIALPDLRAAGGWSPRQAMGLLYPEIAARLLTGDDRRTVAFVNSVAEDARRRLAADHGLDIDRYILQVTLCEYKQTWANAAAYPGRAHDSEVKYYDKTAAHWAGTRHEATQLWAARRALFPAEHLGEHGGWRGIRQDLLPVARQHGYLWSDLARDYLATRRTGDFAHPVPRPPTPASQP